MLYVNHLAVAREIAVITQNLFPLPKVAVPFPLNPAPPAVADQLSEDRVSDKKAPAVNAGAFL